MSLQPVLRYNLDLSGSSPDNKVVGEVHSLPAVAPNRTIAPYYGSFYTTDLKVRDVGGTIEATAYVDVPLTGSAPLIIGSVDLGDNPIGTKRVRLANQDIVNDNGFYQYQVTGSDYTLTPVALGALLTANVDYVPTMLHQDATRVSGKEVCQLIVITNETLMNDVVLEYQAVGGEYSVSSDALDQLIATLNIDARPVVWGEIIGLPNTFPPVDHLHHIQDFKGFGHLIDILDDIRNTLEGGISIGGGSGGGISLHIGPEPPVTPQDNQLWWNNETLRLMLRYVDGPSTDYWVEISGSAGTGSNTVITLTSDAGVLDIDLAVGSLFKINLTENITDINILNPTAKTNFKVDFIQDGDTAYEISAGYPVNFKWTDVPPEVGTEPNSHALLEGTSSNSGTTWLMNLTQYAA